MALRVNSVVVKPAAIYSVDNGTGVVSQIAGGAWQPTPLVFKSNVFAGGLYADVIYAYTLEAAASATTTFDFVGGSTAGFFGNTINFARLKVIALEHALTSLASSIKLGGGTNPVFGANFITPSLHKGASIIMATPDPTAWATGAGATDVITITNNDASNVASWNLLLLGCSA